MKKKAYESPEFAIEWFEQEDICTISTTDFEDTIYDETTDENIGGGFD